MVAATPPGNRLKALRGACRGQHSVHVHAQFRICFRWEDGYAADVEITDNHYTASGAGDRHELGLVPRTPAGLGPAPCAAPVRPHFVGGAAAEC
ncbi:MAG: type II toxin-antitoxin system RelE/ParE family toxin [Gemmatimonas sp.]|uniref:type II toxin-antitoxin system RelE/ParE family toxin n=1 Tax=Gemmatimonas sp. TaxID=1962908 RepID=UPI00391F177C